MGDDCLQISEFVTEELGFPVALQSFGDG